MTEIINSVYTTMDNNTLPAVIKFATNETLVKQVANFFNVSVANVTKQSEVAQATLFDLYEAYRSREKEQLVMYKTVAYIVGTLIILSNLTVVISSGLILRRGQQPKSTYLLLGNVSLADTIIGIAIIFGALIDNSVSSNPLCIFQIGMIVCPAMVSIFSVGLIAVDRYFYILHGLYYQRYFNTTRVRIGIVIIWMIGISLGFMPATGWVNTELIFSRCYYTALFPPSLIFFNACLSLIPIILVTVLYSIVLVHALRNVRDIKTAQKSVHTNFNLDEIPKLRMYRGNTNMNRNLSALSTKTEKTKIRRCASFHALGNHFDKGKFTNKSEKSISMNDFCKNRAKSTDDVSDSTNVKDIYKSLYDESKFSVYTIESSCSDPSILSSGSKAKAIPNKSVLNKFCKAKPPAKPKEPNKWRAITVVMLTTGSFLLTWLPLFITVIFYVFCEEKLTNPRCMYYRTLVAGPLATLAFLNSILNPLIYAWWHKGFQKTVRTLVRKYWCINMPYLSNSSCVNSTSKYP